MLKNYLTTALRHFWKQRTYGILNIAGLTLGLTTSLLILLWVQDELSYDTMHTQADRIYRVNGNFTVNGAVDTWGSVPAPVARVSLESIPEVDNAVRIHNNYDVSLFKYQDKTFTESEKAYVDTSFFSMFDFPLLQGNRQQPFPDLYSVIVTESTARRYFGEADPMGKVMQADGKQDYVVSGVVEDFPANSSIRYDMLFCMDLFAQKFWGNSYFKDMANDWGNFDQSTYLLLQPEASVKEVSNKLTEAIHAAKAEDESDFFFSLQPLLQTHLYNADGTEAGMQEVRIFAIIAFVILLIACINYVNLATARATKRAKEISLRKLIGADRRTLFWQLLAESMLLFTIAIAITLVAADLLMPAYNNLVGKQMSFNALDTTVLYTLAAAFGFTVVTAGIYPALLLSGFEPLDVLKGHSKISSGNSTFRQSLVVIQFTLSITLIIGTLIISQQMDYVRSKKLGYDKENVFVFGMRDMQEHYKSIRNELLQQPGVLAVTSADQQLTNIGSTTGDTDWDGKEPTSTFLIHPMGVDEHFIDDMKLTLVTGRSFSGAPADSAYILLNETTVKEAGITDPIGKRFSLWGREATIIGVVKDFHFASIHQKIEPSVFYYLPEGWSMYIKTTNAEASQAIAAAREQWNKYNPNYPFEYEFMDDAYDQLYKSDQRTGRIFKYFAGIAIFVSCLGLFGLATFAAERRVKEIGIRKVLGASIGGIVRLFALDFMKLVLLSLLIASPLAWYLMSRWLDNFAYRTSLGLGVFLMAGLLGILIAFLTVSYHSIRASLANPVESLRDE